jgi:hypothetical protein
MRQRLGYLAAAAAVLAGVSGGVLRAAPPEALGTISVEARAIEQTLRSSVPIFVDAVGRTLADKGFTTLEGSGHARLVADLSLSRVDVGTTTTKVAVAGSAIEPGGSTSRVGGGISVSLPTAKVRTVPLQQTRLEIRIRKRGEDIVLWHGAALTVRAADTREGQDAAVSSALSEAILRGYPAQSDTVISVP